MAMVFRNLKILLVLLLFQPAVPGDVIKLKNGKVLEGKILATTRKKVLLEDLEGVRWIKRKDIKSIVKKPWVVDIFRKKLEKVSKRMDKAGILGLLDWATAPMRKKSLEPLLPQLYELVIKVCPDNEKARKALGFVKIGGKWYGKKELKKLEEKKRKEKENPLSCMLKALLKMDYASTRWIWEAMDTHFCLDVAQVQVRLISIKTA